MSDANRIYAEVERRKKRAKELGLPETVFRFYYELARYFPAQWTACPSYIPNSVTDVFGSERDVSFSLGRDRYTHSSGHRKHLRFLTAIHIGAANWRCW
jgi:hypothetical protein